MGESTAHRVNIELDLLSFIWAHSHRVGKVLIFSLVVGIGLPSTFLNRRRVCPPPLVLGEGHTRWRERGRESPNSDEEIYTVVLFIDMHVVFGLHVHRG